MAYTYSRQTVDHITIGEETKFYEDKEGREAIAEHEERVSRLEKTTDPDFINSLVAVLFSGGTLKAGITTETGDILVNENGDRIMATKRFTA